MSNHYYTQFCEDFPSITKAEKAWLEEALGPIDRAPSIPILKALEAKGVELDEWPDFDYKFIPEGTKGELFRAESEQFGNPWHLAVLFQLFLKKFRPQMYLTVSWSVSGFRPESGQAAGGAIFITARKLEAIDSNDWCIKRAKRWINKWRNHEDQDAQQPRPRRPSRQGTRARKPHRQARHRKT